MEPFQNGVGAFELQGVFSAPDESPSVLTSSGDGHIVGGQGKSPGIGTGEQIDRRSGGNIFQGFPRRFHTCSIAGIIAPGGDEVNRTSCKSMFEAAVFLEPQIKVPGIGKIFRVCDDMTFAQPQGCGTMFAGTVVVVAVVNAVGTLSESHHAGSVGLENSVCPVIGLDPDGAPFVADADGTGDGVV